MTGPVARENREGTEQRLLISDPKIQGDPGAIRRALKNGRGRQERRSQCCDIRQTRPATAGFEDRGRVGSLQDGFPTHPPEQHGPGTPRLQPRGHRADSDLHSPRVTNVLFPATRSVVLCYRSNQKLTQQLRERERGWQTWPAVPPGHTGQSDPALPFECPSPHQPRPSVTHQAQSRCDSGKRDKGHLWATR